MTYLPDSNACIGYLNGRAVGILQRLQAISAQEVVLCSIVKAELFYGAMKSTIPAQTLAKLNLFLNDFISLPFDDRAAEVHGRIRARLSAMGTPIGSNDLFIASIVLADNVTLLTHNMEESSRIDGLHLEDWELAA